MKLWNFISNLLITYNLIHLGYHFTWVCLGAGSRGWKWVISHFKICRLVLCIILLLNFVRIFRCIFYVNGVSLFWSRDGHLWFFQTYDWEYFIVIFVNDWWIFCKISNFLRSQLSLYTTYFDLYYAYSLHNFILIDEMLIQFWRKTFVNTKPAFTVHK